MSQTGWVPDNEQQSGWVPDEPKQNLKTGAGMLPGEGGPVAPMPNAIPAPPIPDRTTRVKDFGEDVGTGALKGVGNTVSGVSNLINKIPYAGEMLAPRQGISALREMTRPANLPQKIGYYGEQGAEFLTPGLGEEGLAAKAAPLGKYAPVVARIGYNALTSGALNKLQGGSFGSGAVLGGGTSAIGEAGRAMAPSLAESALGIGRRLRGYGRTPGAAILDETSGVRPATIERQAGTKLADLTQELETRALHSTVPASTQPAIDIIDAEMKKATSRNSEAKFNSLLDLKNQLTSDFFHNTPIPRNVPPSKILDLKRGIGDTVGSWNPEVRKGIAPVERKVYSALDKELDRTVPGSDELNQRISSLIPVQSRARATEEGAELPQRIAHRLSAHTGALAAAGIGAGAGYARGGKEGALLGGVSGLILPELITSPTAEVGAARLLNSRLPARIARGGISQLSR